ncbi:MAG: hypothetical protein ACQESP_03005 [Candidatus Muiribacteriota bacterium]
MKKETQALIRSVKKFEEKLNKETEKVTQLVEVVDKALESFKDAGKAHKNLKKKLKELERKTDKLVQYKGFDITKNYEEHNQYKAMKFIDKMKTTVNIIKGINKKSEDIDLRLAKKEYIESLKKKYENNFIIDNSDIIVRNEAGESLVITLGKASETEYYISGITYNAKPGARIQFSTIYKFLDYFSGINNNSTVMKTFLNRK